MTILLQIQLSLIVLAHLGIFATLGSVAKNAEVQDKGNETCPWWLVWNETGGTCNYKCGSGVTGEVVNSSAREVQLYKGFCMTLDTDGMATVAGSCLFTAYNDTCFFQLSCKDVHYCSQYNRQSQLYSKCLQDFAPPVYSYEVRCVNCTQYKYNWLKYTAVAFVPLTVFFIIVILFHITLTSPSINVLIFVFQLTAFPMNIRERISKRADNNPFVKLVATFCGVWNLDFFRLLYPPFCLNPNVSILHVLALDYLTAVYPLLLILMTYFLVKIYDQGCIARCVLRVLNYCTYCQRHWMTKISFIDAFATFLLLSYCKLLYVSMDILVPVKVYDIHGNYSLHVSCNASLKYFGPEHLPFAILAVFVMFVFNIMPTVLLLLYPCRCFQKLLNYCNLRSQIFLHTFTDAFQGYFKDGTNGTRDYRYFAALYLILRIALVSLVNFAFSSQQLLTALVVLVASILLTCFQPYKSSTANFINSAAMSMLAFCSVFSMGLFYARCSYPHNTGQLNKVFNGCIAIFLVACGFFLVYKFRYFFKKFLSSAIIIFVNFFQLIIVCCLPCIARKKEVEGEDEAAVLLPNHPPDN